MVSISRAQNRNNLTSLLLSATCVVLLAALSIHAAVCDVEAGAGAAMISVNVIGFEETTGRRLLVR